MLDAVFEPRNSGGSGTPSRLVSANTAGEESALVCENGTMTVPRDSPESGGGGGTIQPKLKRAFTLPRNPITTLRWRPTVKEEPQQSGGGGAANCPDQTIPGSPPGPDNKRVFRSHSIRKFISRIAQQIGASVPAVMEGRVPAVGLQTWRPTDIPGVTGLKNHGNTCFINAVVQCISHTDLLAEYFVLDRYKSDLSKRNKLNSKKFGTKGELTEQLAMLLKALWACQYSPELSVAFKQVVERHGAQYKGNQQHDALEFLQWLLDKVHEDLNTATKRKYKSIKTSGRPDEVIAAETLENYKRCNNSFIQAVFQAQYRSSLTCSRCRTQSNTFDPFQCISVQLPQFTKHSLYITVLYTMQQPRQVRIGVSLPSGATVAELKSTLESDTSIDRNHMLITEIGEGGFVRTFSDMQSISALNENESIYCIEMAQLKDDVSSNSSLSKNLLSTKCSNEDDDLLTSEYILLCWVNVAQVVTEQVDECGESVSPIQLKGFKRFGSPYTMQVCRETSYDDLQKLILKEMAAILHDDILTGAQRRGVFRMRISDPVYCGNEDEPPVYLDPELEHPLFMEAVDQCLALCSEDQGPQHLKLILEFDEASKSTLIGDDGDVVEEHASVRQLKELARAGGAPLTLDECLRDYTEAETLTDAWRCPHCQQYQPVVKTLDMWSLPDILIVHLKRFRQQSLRGCSSAKLTTMVDFPVNNLDMTPHLARNRIRVAMSQHTLRSCAPDTPQRECTSIHTSDEHQSVRIPATISTVSGASAIVTPTHHHSNQDEPDALYQMGHSDVYDLYAVCYHHGSDLETGHYTSACRNPLNNLWYEFDDAKVTQLNGTTEDGDQDTEPYNLNDILVNNSAYILFYRRRRRSLHIAHRMHSNYQLTSDHETLPLERHWVGRMPRFLPPKNGMCRSTSGGGVSTTVTPLKQPQAPLAPGTGTVPSSEQRQPEKEPSPLPDDALLGAEPRPTPPAPPPLAHPDDLDANITNNGSDLHTAEVVA